MKTILNALREWATNQPNKKVWSFLNDKGVPNDEYTYKELDDSSSALAINLLQIHKLTKGDRILLVFFPGLDFTVSLVACFKCGLIAVPVFPPDPRRLKKDLDHFVNIQISSGAQVVLTNSQYNFVKKIENLRSIFVSETRKWPDLQWIQVDDTLKRGKSKAPQLAALDAVTIDISDVAFLQYTSGSTSDPKGVMISHLNLAHNLSMIVKELDADTSTVVVSWLPQYHDMGLIGTT
jgi:acyl-CoA synthetase (AMP-forming)/AMP-acid ligase II